MWILTDITLPFGEVAVVGGDGSNDATTSHEADIGLAMGKLLHYDGEKFIRTWEYYFVDCAAGFKHTLGVYQVKMHYNGERKSTKNVNEPYNNWHVWQKMLMLHCDG